MYFLLTINNSNFNPSFNRTNWTASFHRFRVWRKPCSVSRSTWNFWLPSLTQTQICIYVIPRFISSPPWTLSGQSQENLSVLSYNTTRLSRCLNLSSLHNELKTSFEFTILSNLRIWRVYPCQITRISRIYHCASMQAFTLIPSYQWNDRLKSWYRYLGIINSWYNVPYHKMLDFAQKSAISKTNGSCLECRTAGSDNTWPEPEESPNCRPYS